MLIDLQRRLAEVGRIRLGVKKVSQRGKAYPAKLDTFRLTSPDQRRIQEAAHLYGGKPAEWSSPAGRQWEVITAATALDVIVPPSDMAFSQAYEVWSAGGCQRRCDGVTEQLTDGPCLCDPDQRDCEIHTRLSVMLRDLPGLGVWRVDTQGYYAAVELGAAVQVIQAAAGKGVLLPARLRLEQRQVKRTGKDGQPETRNFAVPVLDVDVTPRQLLAGQANGAIAIEPGGVDGQLAALDPGDSEPEPQGNLTPVPASVPQRPVTSVADQAAAVEQDQPRSKRRNAQAPLPATGMRPRTAEQAAQEAPAPREQPPPPEEPPDEAPPPAPKPRKLTKKQTEKVVIHCKEAGLDDDGRHVLVGLVTDGRTESSAELYRGAEMDQALVLADAIGAGLLHLVHDGPGGDAVLLKASDNQPMTLPVDVDGARKQIERVKEEAR